LKNNVIGVWGAITAFLSTKTQEAGNKLKTIWENARATLTNLWNNIRSTASFVWEGVKNAVVNPIESAKNRILDIISTIKNAFSNMRITIPEPKLPHVSVNARSKTIGGISIPYPDFDVDWYAQGGIFNVPSVIGVAEAGAEAVLPLERNTGWMDTLASKIAALISGSQAGGDVYVYVGNEQLDAYIHRSQDRRNTKSNGR
jgi:hypothetical protein